MENPKMHSSSRCKSCTYLCGMANYPVSCKPAKGRERKYMWGNLCLPFAMVPCLHHRNVYIKRKLQKWRVQKCIPLVSEKTALTSAGQQTTPSHVSQYRPENGDLRKSGCTFYHGTVFAPKECLYQMEATAMERPKIDSSHQCKNITCLRGTANDPVSSKPV